MAYGTYSDEEEDSGLDLLSYLVLAVGINDPWLLLFLQRAWRRLCGRVSIGGMSGTRHLPLLWHQWTVS